MEFEGVVFKVMPVVKGTSARGEWMKQDVVFDLPGEFNRKACVSFWGDKAQEASSLKPGDAMNVSINIESKEYNGRWFTELRAWKVTRKSAEQSAPSMANDFPPIAPNEEAYTSDSIDDIPF